MVDRLDEERVEILRTWAVRLATKPGPEVRAAGKAITMLLDEVDRLQAELRRVQNASNQLPIHMTNTDEAPGALEAASSQSLGTSLQERLGTATPRIAAADGQE